MQGSASLGKESTRSEAGENRQNQRKKKHRTLFTERRPCLPNGTRIFPKDCSLKPHQIQLLVQVIVPTEDVFTQQTHNSETQSGQLYVRRLQDTSVSRSFRLNRRFSQTPILLQVVILPTPVYRLDKFCRGFMKTLLAVSSYST